MLERHVVRPRWLTQPAIVLVIVATALLVGGIATLADQDAIANVAWVVAAVVPLVMLLRGMVTDLMRGHVGVDVIAVLAIGGALAIGEYLTAGIIGLMLATGEFLEVFAAGRAERELTALIERAPTSAHRVTGDGVVTVDIDTVAPGDVLLVKPGEVVPVDGLVKSDVATFDESALTGESAPVERTRSTRVASGVVNAAGPAQIWAVTSAEEGTYAAIVRLVQEAAEDRPPAVRLADRWAALFVPLVLAVAAIAWWVSGDVMRALAVLVVATPCPLLLAVPIAIVSGMSRGASHGVIFRGGGALETLARCQSLLIDKTGTLTVGYPVVHRIVSFDADCEPTDALRLAASVEQMSAHILARALVTEAQQKSLTLAMPDHVVEEAGGGIAGEVDGRRVAVGAARWILGSDTEPPAVRSFRRAIQRSGPLATFIGIDGSLVAGVAFVDVIRPDAATTIRALRRSGIQRLVMATGDHPTVAHAVGLAVGVDAVLPECTPSEKVDAVRDLQTEGPTAMAGDGINDAPALAVADVGIAMGARGATASSEAADIVIMVDRFDAILTAVRTAHRSRSIALQSVITGMGLSMIAMGAAAFGLIVPIAGALLQEVIDLIAIGNALRALRDDPMQRGSPQLPEELSRELRRDHDLLMPRLAAIADTADLLDQVDASEARRHLVELRAFLVDEVLPHEQEDERRIYPLIEKMIGGDDPLQSMSRSHREIFHLATRFGHLVDDLAEEGPDQQDLPELRRILYSLHAVLRLHFDQEEELYASLDVDYRPPTSGTDQWHEILDKDPHSIPR